MNNTSTFDSVYSIKLAQIAALNGDTTKKYDSVYDEELEVLKKLEEGGMGALIDDNNVSTGKVWSSSKTNTQIQTKQDTLVSGTNIKTINNESIVGSGNLEISGGSGVVELTLAQYDALAVKDPSTIYNITDATPYVMEDYVTKTAFNTSMGALDTKYNPYNATTPYSTASTGYFVSWNSYGQIIGKGSYAYQKNLSVNGNQHTLYATSSTAFQNIYAPITAGTNGQVLQSRGSGAPQWVDYKSDATAYIDESDCSAGTYSTNISTFYRECIAALKIGPLQMVHAVDHLVPMIDLKESSFIASVKCAVENNAAAHVTYDDGTTQHTLTLNSDGTVSDPDNTGAVTALTPSVILGYNIFNVVMPISVVDGEVYSIKTEQHRSYSFYLPSSTRLYEGNVELWFFTTENGATWRNFHVLITSTTVTSDVTTGTFGQ